MKKLSSHPVFRSSRVPSKKRTLGMGRIIVAALVVLLLGPALAGQTIIPNYGKAREDFFWPKLYVFGGWTLYCAAPFGSGSFGSASSIARSISASIAALRVAGSFTRHSAVKATLGEFPARRIAPQAGANRLCLGAYFRSHFSKRVRPAGVMVYVASIMTP